MRYWHLFLLVSFSLSFSVLADSVFSESAGEYAQKGFHCELYDDAEEVYQCLEDFGNALLLPGSQADKEFKRELKEILIRHPKISRGYLNLISLSERFRFRVKDEEKRNGITGGNCLELDRLANSWKRYLQIKSVKAQMVQLANGMARLHANGLGENNFYFFGINVLRVCDLKVCRRWEKGLLR